MRLKFILSFFCFCFKYTWQISGYTAQNVNHRIASNRSSRDLFQFNLQPLFHVDVVATFTPLFPPFFSYLLLLLSVLSHEYLDYRNPVIYYTPAVVSVPFFPSVTVMCLPTVVISCSQQPFCVCVKFPLWLPVLPHLRYYAVSVTNANAVCPFEGFRGRF